MYTADDEVEHKPRTPTLAMEAQSPFDAPESEKLWES